MPAPYDCTKNVPTAASMEVLLLKDIPGVGKKNDLLVVGDGYALNFLLPRRHALVATPTVRKRFADQIKRRAEEKDRERLAMQGVQTALAGKSVRISHKATKTGKLYAGVSSQEIAAAVKEQFSLELSAESIVITDPIKSAGTFPVQIKVGEASTTLSVIVTVTEEVKKKAVKK
jgi:large subunit ribosomal protein L9